MIGSLFSITFVSTKGALAIQLDGKYSSSALRSLMNHMNNETEL